MKNTEICIEGDKQKKMIHTIKVLIECFPELNICSPDPLLLLQSQHVCDNEEYKRVCTLIGLHGFIRFIRT